MKNFFVVIGFMCICFNGNAQKLKCFGGAQVNFPNTEGIEKTGFGISFTGSFQVFNRIALVADAGLNRFPSPIIINSRLYNPSSPVKGDTVKGFTFVSGNLGARWLVTRHIYLQASLGAVAGIEISSSRPAIAHSIGILLPNRTAPVLDFSATISHVLSRSFIFPEDDFLKNGGYSYVSLRLAYKAFSQKAKRTPAPSVPQR
jgi:hypothetical protein